MNTFATREWFKCNRMEPTKGGNPIVHPKDGVECTNGGAKLRGVTKCGNPKARHEDRVECTFGDTSPCKPNPPPIEGRSHG